MKVRNVMHTGVVSVSPASSISEIARTMRDRDIGSVPVVENGEIVGIVTDRDLACRALAANTDVSHLKARDIMSRNVVCCTADEDIKDAIHTMEARKVRRMPVLDDRRHMIGLLSLGDISHKAGAEMSAEMLRAVSSHHAR